MAFNFDSLNLPPATAPAEFLERNGSSVKARVNGEVYDVVALAGGARPADGDKAGVVFLDRRGQRQPVWVGSGKGQQRTRSRVPSGPYTFGTWQQAWAVPGLSGTAPYFQRCQPFHPYYPDADPDLDPDPQEQPESIWHTGQGVIGAAGFVAWDTPVGIPALGWVDFIPQGFSYRMRVTAILAGLGGPDAAPVELYWQTVLPELYAPASPGLEANDGAIFCDPGDVFSSNPVRRIIVPGPGWADNGADRVVVLNADTGAVITNQRLGYRLEQTAFAWDMAVKGWHVPLAYADLTERLQADHLIRAWRRKGKSAPYSIAWTLDPVELVPISEPVATAQSGLGGRRGRWPVRDDGVTVLAVAGHSRLSNSAEDKLIGFEPGAINVPFGGEHAGAVLAGDRPGPYDSRTRAVSLTIRGVRANGTTAFARTLTKTPAMILDTESCDAITLGAGIGIPDDGGSSTGVGTAYTDAGVATHLMATYGTVSYTAIDHCGELREDVVQPMPGVSSTNFPGGTLTPFALPDLEHFPNGLGYLGFPLTGSPAGWVPQEFGITLDSERRAYYAYIEPVTYGEGRDAAVFVPTGTTEVMEPDMIHVGPPAPDGHDEPNPCAGLPMSIVLHFDRHLWPALVATGRTWLECLDADGELAPGFPVDISEEAIPEGVTSTLLRPVILQVWDVQRLEPPVYDRVLVLRRLLDMTAALELRAFSDPATPVQVVNLVGFLDITETFDAAGEGEDPDIRSRWGVPSTDPVLKCGISPNETDFPARPWVLVAFEMYDYKRNFEGGTGAERPERVFFTRVWWRDGIEDPPVVQQWDLPKDNGRPGVGFAEYPSEFAALTFLRDQTGADGRPLHDWAFWFEPTQVVGDESDTGGAGSGAGQHLRRQRLYDQIGV